MTTIRRAIGYTVVLVGWGIGAVGLAITCAGLWLADRSDVLSVLRHTED